MLETTACRQGIEPTVVHVLAGIEPVIRVDSGHLKTSKAVDSLSKQSSRDRVASPVPDSRCTTDVPMRQLLSPVQAGLDRASS